MSTFRLMQTLFIAAILIGGSGCGYSEEEWQAQLDKYQQVVRQKQSTEARLADTEKKLAAAKSRVDKLEQDLTNAGVDLSKLSADLESRNMELNNVSTTLQQKEQALKEYMARAAQLERIKKRFELLRTKLNELVSLGLEVTIRKNRMIISLPGDVLFASGQDRLNPKGQEVLGKVASTINGDGSLRQRFYQVAGHTDDKPYRGVFRDNWGLSLMRARSVLLYLIDPKQGSLPVARWSAAGFADTDPIAPNESEGGRSKNRRCEIIVVPSAEEVLDLKALTGAPN
ncbi:MAG: OmpA family protein [Myxococcota bacterium]